MDQKVIWGLVVSVTLMIGATTSESESTEDVRNSLTQFMNQLSGGKPPQVSNFGWNLSSDPCNDKWVGVFCEKRTGSVRKIVLEGYNLNGILDMGSLCIAKSLAVLSLNDNGLHGKVPKSVSACKSLTHLYLRNNKFSGSIPEEVSRLSNLKRLDISHNGFSGELPNLGLISGIISFLAQHNDLRGAIPSFDFYNLEEFNVSFNGFRGQIPDLHGKFGASCVLGNPALCGEPKEDGCDQSSPDTSVAANSSSSQGLSIKQTVIISACIVLGLVVVVFIAIRFIRYKKAGPPQEKVSSTKSNNDSYTLSEAYEYSGNHTKLVSSMSTPLVVLTSPVVRELKFDDLLRAPAELLGKGRNGSMYMVTLSDGAALVVKRLKDISISADKFSSRMQKIDQVKHPNVLPQVAFYCCGQEKLLVYEFQCNGSLHRRLHQRQYGERFGWRDRLNVASTLAKALAFMHEHLLHDDISHGNLKSSNILFDKGMEPCLTEYGLGTQDQKDTWKMDVYGFGVLLLELLTGKPVQATNGLELAKWVNSVVREEWTAEVFDKELISGGANEERMVNLLQVALKCTAPNPLGRPNMTQVVSMIGTIQEEEDKSFVSQSLEV